MRLLPHQNDTGGFFIAVLTRLRPEPVFEAKMKTQSQLHPQTSASPDAPKSKPVAAPASRSTGMPESGHVPDLNPHFTGAAANPAATSSVLPTTTPSTSNTVVTTTTTTTMTNNAVTTTAATATTTSNEITHATCDATTTTSTSNIVEGGDKSSSNQTSNTSKAKTNNDAVATSASTAAIGGALPAYIYHSLSAHRHICLYYVQQHVCVRVRIFVLMTTYVCVGMYRKRGYVLPQADVGVVGRA